jgi:hypothetical protein
LQRRWRKGVIVGIAAIVEVEAQQCGAIAEVAEHDANPAAATGCLSLQSPPARFGFCPCAPRLRVIGAEGSSHRGIGHLGFAAVAVLVLACFLPPCSPTREVGEVGNP